MSAPPWTPFLPASIPETALADETTCWLNSRYQVLVTESGRTQEGCRIWTLSIKRLDKAPIHDWRDLQRIKNELVDPEAEAVELYPAESRLVDTANQYWLTVFDPPFRFPFGFEERLVSEDPGGKAVQRPFEPDARPKDLRTAEQLAWDAKKLAKRRGGKR